MTTVTQTHAAECDRQIACRLSLVGNLQGLGVRPSLYRLAHKLKLAGSVYNSLSGVVVELEGPANTIQQFVAQLPAALPDGAECRQIDRQPLAPASRSEFQIACPQDAGVPSVAVPADRVACARCLEEVADATNRRHQYPFVSCTDCGPRYTIIRRLPYERVDTTMSQFTLCDACQREYRQVTDRRFHAQTNACPTCGPRVWSRSADGRDLGAGAIAVRSAAHLLSAGQIVAIRGLGGYQLLVDANDDQAVKRLRERKRRAGKPLAVLVANLEQARRLAEIDGDEQRELTSAANPIVLLTARAANGVSAQVHPGLPTIGLLLPTTPLHALLAAQVGRPLVCTSGNRDGDPLAVDAAEAERMLAEIADAFLHHDRPIARPLDDSVVRVIAGRPTTVRLARGLAPWPLELPALDPAMALGGQLKSAVAWTNGRQAVLGPHVGDLATPAARDRLLMHLDDCRQLYQFAPRQWIHDMHPEYFTTDWVCRQTLPALAVQHHHAHIAAGMLEYGWRDRRVLGVAWDGTGYGTDGTIWGGEFLQCEGTQCARVASLRPFRLPGGERSVREPWRCALSVGTESLGDRFAGACPAVAALPLAAAVQSILDRQPFSPLTTSAGRLFDAAAAIVLGQHFVDYEGQAAMAMEGIADCSVRGSLPFPLRETRGHLELDWRPLIEALVAGVSAGLDPPVLAVRFHRALADGIAAVCQRFPQLPIVVSGGVFQNRLLTECVAERLGHRQLGLPGRIPVNDGGLAAGQLTLATQSSLLAPRAEAC